MLDLEFEIEYTVKNNPCYGYDSGTINIDKVTGDFQVPIFHYWSDRNYTDGSPDLKRDRLTKGVYIVYSVDDQNCFRYDTIEITEPEDVTIVLDTLVGERCASGIYRNFAEAVPLPIPIRGFPTNSLPTDTHLRL